MQPTALRTWETATGSAQPAVLPFGLARLATPLYRGMSVKEAQAVLAARVLSDMNDAAALMDLAVLCRLAGDNDRAAQCQRHALELQQIYRLPASDAQAATLRLLMFAVPGDFMANTPVEFLIDGSPVQLDVVYIEPGRHIPTDIPEHDLALVGIAESEAATSAFMSLAPLLAAWPKPVLNMPTRIIELARERLCDVLSPLPGVAIPPTVWVNSATLRQIVVGELQLQALARELRFPIIARPAGSHAGNGLAKIDDEGALFAYLLQQPADNHYISCFVDYRSADGQFRKYRIALIEGRPFLCHMAISSEWMVHYLNAGMQTDPAKRAEEAKHMADFETDFAARHAEALAGIAAALDLDYVAIDCAETRDGRLLVFEAGTAMIVHRMDPPELFPYKQAQMDKVCDAFIGMLRARAGM